MVALARVSSASMPAMPAARATMKVELLTVVSPSSTPTSTEKPDGSRSRRSRSAVSTPADEAGDPEPGYERPEGAPDQPPAAQHKPDAARRDRQQVRGDGHGAHDQDPAAIDHAV